MENLKSETETSPKKSAKGISDPVHTWIPLSVEELNIIDHPIFQRLRHVRQLNGTEMSYPSAKHTRFSHSIGAAHVAGLYATHLSNLSSSVSLSQVTKSRNPVKTLRISALLHDIAHGFCSHEFDKVYKDLGIPVESEQNDELRLIRRGKYPNQTPVYSHDQKRFDLLYHCKSFRKVVEAAGVTFEEIANVWNGCDNVLHAIIQGPLGADRSDFLLRDSLFTAVNFGQIQLERIIASSSIQKVSKSHEKSFCLVYHEKVLPSICSALIGRFEMYRQVYLHKSSSAASILFSDMLESVMEILDIKALAQSNDDNEFVKLTDSYIMGFLEHAHLLQDEKSLEILEKGIEALKRYKSRDLPKICFQKTVTPNDKSVVEQGLKESLCDISPDLYIIQSYGPTYMLDIKTFEKDNVSILDSGGNVILFVQAVEKELYFRGILEKDVGHSIIRVYALYKENRIEITKLLE